MPDEATAPAPQDQPNVEESAPDTGTSAEPTSEAPDYFEDNFDPSTLPEDLLPAYKQMQGAFTQKTQSLAEQRKEAEAATQWLQALTSDNPQVQAHALEQLGLELDLEDEADEFADEFDDEESDDDYFRDPRLDQLLEELEAAEQEEQREQQVAQALDFIDSRIDELAKSKNVTLTEDEKDAAFLWAVHSADSSPDGSFDVDAAFNRVVALRDAAVKSYRKTKQDAPAPPPTGTSGVPQVPTSDADTLKRMEEVAARVLDSH